MSHYGAYVAKTGARLSTRMELPLRGSAITAPVLVTAVGLNGIGLAALAFGHLRLAVALVLAPIVLFVVGALVGSDGTVLVVAALTLQLTLPQLNEPLPFGGSLEVFPSDIVVLLAVATWFADRAFAGPEQRLRLRELRGLSPVLGLPIILFTIAIGSAALRGHYAYGASLVGRPARMFLYAAIGVAIVRVDPRRLYRAVVIAFYAGAVWQLFNALYYLATGGSQSIAPDLSTGGTRVLSIAVSLYLAGTFFLALINLSLEGSAGAKALHATILLLSAVEIGLAYSRGTFLTVALLGTILFLSLRDVRTGTLATLPLAIPILVVGILLIARTDSTVIPTFVKRINPSISSDQSVRWREKANGELVKQFHESPFDGVGFGKDIHFIIDSQEVQTSQQAHNDFLYLLAGSGIFGLGSFLLILGIAIGDAARRLRHATEPHERALLLFAAVTAASFVLNGLVEPLITLPTVLLTIWTLLLLPMAVRPSPATATAPRGCLRLP